MNSDSYRRNRQRQKHAAGFHSTQVNRARIDQLKPRPGGYDHNFVLDAGGNSLAMAARVCEPKSGRIMEVHTTEPGVQLYTATFSMAA